MRHNAGGSQGWIACSFTLLGVKETNSSHICTSMCIYDPYGLESVGAHKEEKRRENHDRA